jgi:phosphate-selective porin
MTKPSWLLRSLAAAVAVACLVPAAWAQDDSTAVASETHAQLEAMNEQLQTIQADVLALKKFKFSGYVQARYEITEDSADSVRVEANGTITPANKERFYIRRARLKLTYEASPIAQGVIYFDGGADRIARLLEAYVVLMDPWTVEHVHSLTMGQMNVPFGYELERSSSARELPERSRAENTLFPGERDRGLKIVSMWTPQVETVLGVYNGGGVNHPFFSATDPSRAKDLVGRVRVMQGMIDGAVSASVGTENVPLAGPDKELDKTRYGADAQLYFAVPGLGGASLMAEGYIGQNLNSDSLAALTTRVSGAPIQPVAGANLDHLSTDFVGGYLMFVQNFGDRAQVAVRWDMYDPNTDLDHDQFTRWNAGFNWFWDGHTRLTVSYEAPETDRARAGSYYDPKDNFWTFQAQLRF